MKNWITILTFTYPHEAYVVKAKLESEGVEVNLKDELTTQVHNFYSNAIGGVKLQVQEADLFRVQEVLSETDYLQEVGGDDDSTRIYRLFDSKTSKIPLLGKMRAEFRFMILLAVVSSLFFVVAAFSFHPTKSEILVQNKWCVEYFSYQGREYKPNTLGYVRYSVGCEEFITFEENGQIIFPGFASSEIYGRWDLYRNSLYIYNLDTLSFVLKGDYTVEIDEDRIVLESEHSKFIANSKK